MYTSFVIDTHNFSQMLDSFADIIDLAMKGDPSKVDMMVSKSRTAMFGLVCRLIGWDSSLWQVGDIYGKNSQALEKVGLSSNIVASRYAPRPINSD